MKIKKIEAWEETFPLTRPYAISYRYLDSVNNFIIKITTDTGEIGLGAASPSEQVTKESYDNTRKVLGSGQSEELIWMIGEDIRQVPHLCRKLQQQLAHTPAARACVDMALHDLYAQSLKIPLVDLWGRCHQQLPTSITIGIKSLQETLEEAQEYLDRGFFIIKVKLGKNLEEDIERMIKLREKVGSETLLRVDANQGQSASELKEFFQKTKHLNIELMEQPLKASSSEDEVMRKLPEEIKCKVAADESVVNPQDALHLLRPTPACGIWNIKLMKCGGPFTAKIMANMAEVAGIDLMWGCNDESRISIAAALHVALSSPATKYLDLDGHLDLSRDLVSEGFSLEKGMMRLLDRSGLGVKFLG